MGKVLINSSTLEDIADAIRAKTNSNEKLQPSQMATAIRGIIGASTTGDLYVSSSTPFRYRIVNPDPNHQDLTVTSSSSIDTNQTVYVKLAYSLSSKVAGYVVGDATRYYDSESNEYVFSITAPSFVADVSSDGYTIIYANGGNFYTDYEGTNSTVSTLTGKVCLLKTQGAGSIELAGKSGSVSELYIPEITRSGYYLLQVYNSSTNFTINMPNLVRIDPYALQYTNGLSVAYMPKLEYIDKEAFYNSQQFKTLVIEQTNSVCTLIDDNTFGRTHSDLKIYVPDSMVSAYKADSAWGNYSSRIYPVSEYVREG